MRNYICPCVGKNVEGDLLALLYPFNNCLMWPIGVCSITNGNNSTKKYLIKTYLHAVIKSKCKKKLRVKQLDEMYQLVLNNQVNLAPIYFGLS